MTASSEYAVETFNLTKKFKVVETLPGEEERSKLARFLFGESFRGRVRVRERVVLDRVNLKVKAGECLGLLGPNGAGKTTLLEILATALLPDDGTAKVMGYDVVRESGKVRRCITPVLPQFSVYDMWTARRNLEYAALLHDVPLGEVRRRVREALELVGLSERADDLVRKFSTGMRARLILAMGLVVDNPVYLMDEPFTGIDPGTAKQLRGFVRRELLEKRGRTVLLATNMLADAEELCDRVAIINEGRVVAVDTPANLKRKVQGVETVDLEVLTENAEALVDAVKGLDGVKACYLLRSASNPPGVASLRVLTPDSRSLLPNLIEAIHKANGKVRYVKVHEPTLEDVFIHYTGRGLCE